MPWPGVALLFYANWPATVGECGLEFFSVMLLIFCPIPLRGECGACLPTNISFALTSLILNPTPLSYFYRSEMQAVFKWGHI